MEETIKVLLVDDEDRFCETTSKRLKRKGFDAIYTNSGEMALRILKDTPRDVVVLDIKMAGMDGMTALSEIKKQYPDIQVIMLSGHGTQHSAMRALIREAFDFLAKPCDPEILALRIRDAGMTGRHGYEVDARKVQDIMTRLSDLVTIPPDIPVARIMDKLIGTNDEAPSWPLAVDNAPRLLLVENEDKTPVGVLTRMDIIKAVRPEYVSAGESSLKDSYRFSPIFWSGFFSGRVSEIAQKTVREVMSVLPPVISETANLLEAAFLMWKTSRRLLLVKDISKPVGMVTDKALFFEIAAEMKKQ